jgi:hypothetical protein
LSVKPGQGDRKRPEAKTECDPSTRIAKERGGHWLRASLAVTDDLSLPSFLPEAAFSVRQDGFFPLQEIGEDL